MSNAENTTRSQNQRAQVLNSMQEVMGPLPDRTSLPSLDVEVIETVRLSGIERRRLTYVSEHGDRVPA